MKKSPIFLLLFVALIIGACNKLSDFDKQLIGIWESISYVADTTDLSSDYHAKLFLQKDGGFEFQYPYQEGFLSYLLTYETSGKWHSSEVEQSILFEDYASSWTSLKASYMPDASLHLTGRFKGSLISIVMVKQ